MDEPPVRERDPATAPSGGAPRGGSRRAKPRRPAIRPRGSLIAAVDIGTTKVCCFIARISDDNPRVLGIGHQISRGVRNGTIVDLEAAGTSVVNAVHAAEQMAGETIQQVVTNLSGGFFASRLVKAEISVSGRECRYRSARVLEQGI
jgi:cell division protein FtsA